MAKRMWRKVIKSDLQLGCGKSIFPPYLPLGNVWELELECGHTIYRQPRYKPLEGDMRALYRRGGWFYRRSSDDALPAPKRVICQKCESSKDNS